MKTVLVVAMLGMVVLAGCSQYDIRYDYDMDSNFSAFHTYNWIEKPVALKSESATQAMQNNTLLDKRIRSAVDTQMTREGFTMSADNPDVLIVYHTGMKDKVDVTDWGYTYAGSYWGGGLGRNVDVYQYTEGTLIIDMVRASDHDLVWRGTATGVVEPGNSPEKVEQRLNDVVAKIFENYPPKKK